VDRGFNSLEVFTILLLLKARYLVSFLFGDRLIVDCLLDFGNQSFCCLASSVAAASLFRFVSIIEPH
jgi:hypothetical protein